MARLLAAYQSLPQDLEPAAFDVKAKAAALGSDPAAAFAFVRDEIANEVYPGVLRGPAGTLQAGAGNDLDKSLLLGTLLVGANHSVRYAHCTLEPEAAQARLAALFVTPPTAKSRQADVGPALKTALLRSGFSGARATEIVGTRQAAHAWLDGAIVETARADLDVVRGAMDRAAIAPLATASDPQIAEDARNHYWIQLNRGGSWEDMDPAAGTAGAGSTICTAVETYAELPPEVFQTITIAIRNEYVEGEALRSEQVLSQRFKVSELYGRVLMCTNVGTDLPEGSPQPTGIARFVPFLATDTEVFPGSEYAALPSSTQGAAGLFDTFGEIAGGASGQSMLGAQWMDFVLEAPGRRSEVSRALVDLIVASERAEGVIRTRPDPAAVALSLSESAAIAVSAGPIHPAVVLRTAYADLDAQAAGRVFDAPAEQANEEPGLAEDWALTGDRLLAAHALAYAVSSERALAELAKAAGPHVRLVRDQPMITISNVTIRSGGDRKSLSAELSIDLRHDRIRVVTDSPAHVAEGFWANAMHGLVDGALERHVPATAARAAHIPAAPTRARFDTSLAFQLARAQGIEVRAGAGDSARQLLLGALADGGGRRLASEVTDATAIVVPVQGIAVQDERRFGLWALNLQTGDLLSLLDTGLRGQANQEYNLQRYIKFAEAQVRRCVQNRTNMEVCRKMFQSWADAVNRLHELMNISVRVIMNEGHFVTVTL